MNDKKTQFCLMRINALTTERQEISKTMLAVIELREQSTSPELKLTYSCLMANYILQKQLIDELILIYKNALENSPEVKQFLTNLQNFKNN